MDLEGFHLLKRLPGQGFCKHCGAPSGHATVFAIVFSAFGKSTMRAMLDQYASLIHPFEVWNICGAATPG